MTVFAVVLLLLPVLAVVAMGLPTLAGTDAAAVAQARRADVVGSVLAAMYGGVLLHAARRLRRPGAGRLWYPLLLCAVTALVGVRYAATNPFLFAQGVAFTAATVMLMRLSARVWVRP